MGLTKRYVVVYGKFPKFFEELSKGQAPQQFSAQHLKDLGYTSSNDRALIPLLKDLGFLSKDGTPTARYHEFRNSHKSKSVLGESLREAYQDIFTLRKHPDESNDRQLIEGKFKSAHNVSDRLAKEMANTFFGLLSLADVKVSDDKSKQASEEQPETDQSKSIPIQNRSKQLGGGITSLHYNIQIHLPATKDLEVYSAIFKSLKEHLVE
ncbi:MAG: DUF5343 domain-containing protein [Nitrospinae bacterium]|nr:DUF5343 domain-containing protein [Nitrospinota bacterium]